MLVLALTLLAAPPRATAERSRGAEVGLLADRGVKAFDAGDYERALAAYREAHSLMALPQLSFMIGRCLEVLGQPAEAAAAFERALTESPGAALRQRIESELAEVREKLRVGRLVLTIDPPGTELRVDGRLVGRAPLDPLALEPGTHRLSLSHPERKSLEAIVEIAGGAERSLELTLDARPEPPPPEPPPDDVGDGAAGDPDDPPVVVAASRRWYHSTAGWAVLGSGLAVAAGGGALLGVAEMERADVRRAVDQLRAGEDPSLSHGDAHAKQERADAEEIAGWVLVGVGGAAVVTSIVLFVTLGGAEPAAPTTVLAPTLLPGGGGLSLGGRF